MNRYWRSVQYQNRNNHLAAVIGDDSLESFTKAEFWQLAEFSFVIKWLDYVPTKSGTPRWMTEVRVPGYDVGLELWQEDIDLIAHIADIEIEGSIEFDTPLDVYSARAISYKARRLKGVGGLFVEGQGYITIADVKDGWQPGTCDNLESADVLDTLMTAADLKARTVDVWSIKSPFTYWTEKVRS